MAEKNYKYNAIERWLAFLEKDISEDTLRELVAMEPASGYFIIRYFS